MGGTNPSACGGGSARDRPERAGADLDVDVGDARDAVAGALGVGDEVDEVARGPAAAARQP